MKSPSEEKTRRDRGRRDKKRVNQSPHLAIPEEVELPEPPVFPDVYTETAARFIQLANNNQNLSPSG